MNYTTVEKVNEILPMSLMDGLHVELKRAKELLKCYEEIPTSAFGASITRQAIEHAERSIEDEDVVEMIRAHEQLKKLE